MLNTILIDLDGTLFPTDQDSFVHTYFRELTKKIAPFGYEKKPVIDALWAGTAAMVKNNGERSNHDVFWDVFAKLLGEEIRPLEPVFDKFYSNEFYVIRTLIPEGFDLSRRVIHTLRQKGYRVILASNPIFPLDAYETRLDCLGLHISDFEFVTSYETSFYSKPNLDYYRRILEQAGKKADECMMVGNNIGEDMCADRLGMRVFYVNDYPEGGGDESAYPHGSLADFLAFVETLPTLK